MITPISLADAAALLATLVAMVVLLAAGKGAVARSVRVILFCLLLLSLVHNLGNLLEWAGLSPTLESYEDFVVPLIPVLFMFLVYVYLRRHSEDVLRQSKERYEMLFNSGNDAVFVHGYREDGLPGAFVEVNELACRLLGYSRAELIGLTTRDIIAPEFHENEDSTSRLLLEKKRLIFERVLVGKDGGRIPVEISGRVFELGGSAVCLSVARDLSGRKSMEEQIRRSQRLESVGRLAGGIAHDFNNLLTVIGGYSEELLNEIEPGSPWREEVEEIRSAADRASSLTRQLLAFSRKQFFQVRTVDLGVLARKSEQMLRRLIGEDIRLAIDVAEDLWKIRADPGQIDQVILNLAVNARDAMPEGGWITIRLDNSIPEPAEIARRPGMVAGSYVLMSFSDTGVGMSPETLSHIFEPFFTTKEMGKGTGLGLSTVYGIIKQSGGFIYALSEAGRGTAFEIYLPGIEADAQETDAPPAESSGAAEARAGATVLVVEDESWVRSFIRSALQRSGFTILEAENGERALEICTEIDKPVDLVITDLVMPGMTGIELCGRLREQLPDMRCLLISGYAQDRIREQDISEKRIPFLAKPFSAKQLLEQIDRLLAG